MTMAGSRVRGRDVAALLALKGNTSGRACLKPVPTQLHYAMQRRATGNSDLLRSLERPHDLPSPNHSNFPP